ncbi:MAG: type II secretion system protein [Kangiellaceae bacterium]|jgi:MSHA pilin protein MshC
MKHPKPPQLQVAFTLIELIVVVILLAIISAYVFTKFSSSSGYRLDSTAETIVSAGQLAQQLSMNDSQRNFSLSIQANQVDIIEDGNTFSGSQDFPIQFDSSVTVSPVINITFDSLGQTTATTVTVTSDDSVAICFESSGLIRRC